MNDMDASNKGALVVRAYCAKCGKLLMESVRMSKKQLISMWDKTVLGAVHIKCEDCGLKFPNFDIELRIYNSTIKREFEASKYVKLPKSKKGEVDAIFKGLYREIDSTGLDVEKSVSKMNEIRNEVSNTSLESRFSEELSRRSKNNGEISAN